MSQNQTQQVESGRTFVSYETEEGEEVAELRTPDHEDEMVTFRRLAAEESPLHEEIRMAADARGVPAYILDLPTVMTPRYDEDGYLYVSDLNNILRYYIGGEGQLILTDEFVENARMVESNERTNTLEQIYGVA